MKIYDYDTEFTFGKHKGKKLIDVVTSDWDYINWCQEHLDNFIFAEEMMYVLEEPNGEFKFSKLALDRRQENLDLLRNKRKYLVFEKVNCCDNEIKDFYKRFFSDRRRYHEDDVEVAIAENDLVIRVRNSSFSPSLDDYELAFVYRFFLLNGEVGFIGYTECVDGGTEKWHEKVKNEDEMIAYIKENKLIPALRKK